MKRLAKKFKNAIIIAALIAAIGLIFPPSFGGAQFRAPNFFKRLKNAVTFINSKWQFGSETDRIDFIWTDSSNTTNATSTNATTTNLAILSITSNCLETDGNGTVIGSGAVCAGAAAGGAWEAFGSDSSILTPTTSAAGILVNAATSTITQLIVNNATTTTLVVGTSNPTTNLANGDLLVGNDILTDADSSADIGSSSNFWANLYTDAIVFDTSSDDSIIGNSTGIQIGLSAFRETGLGGVPINNQPLTVYANSGNAQIIEFDNDATGGYVIKFDIDSSSNGADIGQLSFNALDSNANVTEYARITGELLTGTGGSERGTVLFHVTIDGSITHIASVDALGISTITDSTFDLGTPSSFWDETFTDELVVNSSDGTSATAANEVRISGQDLSAGDAGLLITTENDTDHLFASLVGINTVNPTAQLEVNGGILATASSTIIGNFRIDGSATTTATSTVQGLKGLNLISCNTIDTDAAGHFSCGVDATSAWEFDFTNALTPTTSAIGLFVTASSTFDSTLRVNATSTFVGGDVQIGLATTTIKDAALLVIPTSADEHGIIVQGAVGQSEHILMVRSSARTRLFNISQNGEAEFFHTATEDGDHTIHLETTVAGFGGVIGIFNDYDAGALAAGEDASLILLTIDRFSTTGGDIHGVSCSATTGSAEAHCIEAQPGLSVIRQASGTFGDMDECTDTGNDILSSCTSTASDVTLFTNNTNHLVIGDAAQFSAIEVILATESNKSIVPTFEFSIGSDTWTTFFPTDGTNGFQDTAIISWELDDIPTWATGTSTRYFIRITRTRTGNIATLPVEDILQISATNVFFWDEDGQIRISEINATTTQIDTLTVNTNLNPDANDGAPLGTATVSWSDLFLASAAVINFNNGDVTLTHSSNLLALGGGDFTVSGNATTSGYFVIGTTNPLNNMAAGDLLIGNNATTTGELTVVGELNIPNGTAPTADEAADIAFDTTSNNLVIATTTAQDDQIAFASATSTLYSFVLASTSVDFVSGGSIPLPSHWFEQFAIGVICQVETGTSVVINLSDTGTNDTNAVTCTTTITQFEFTTNQTFTANEAVRLELGTVTGSVDYLTIRVVGYRLTD